MRPLPRAGNRYTCTSKFCEAAFAGVQGEEDRSGHTCMALWLSFPIICKATQLNFNGREDNMPLIWAVIEHVPNWNTVERPLQGGSYNSISEFYLWCAPGVALLLAPASSNLHAAMSKTPRRYTKTCSVVRLIWNVQRAVWLVEQRMNCGTFSHKGHQFRSHPSWYQPNSPKQTLLFLGVFHRE